MSAHGHREYVKGCFRCELSCLEVERGMSIIEADEYEDAGFERLLAAIESPVAYWEERCARAEDRLYDVGALADFCRATHDPTMVAVADCIHAVIRGTRTSGVANSPEPTKKEES